MDYFESFYAFLLKTLVPSLYSLKKLKQNEALLSK